MTARLARPICAVVVVVLIARTARAGALDADPAVRVVEVAAGAAGSGGSILLRNSGPTAVTASRITASPGCSAAVQVSPLGGFMLAPGETQSLAIACAASPAGMQRCTYQVRAPDKTVLAELEAVCAYGATPGLAADRTFVDLGTVMVGNVSTTSIALRNTGASPIDHLFIETTDLAGDFAVAAPCNPDGRECDAGVTLAAGDTTTLVVTCTPRSAGAHTAALHVVSSEGSRLAEPIALACTGTAATTPVLSTSPGAVDVGRIAVVDATATTRVHLSNAGTGTLRVLGIQLLDGGTGAATDWTVSAGAPCNPAIPPLCLLSPGKTADLELVFDPHAPGVRDAILLVNFHDTADRSLAIRLHGIGDGPTLEILAATRMLEFGALRPGTAGTLTLAISNRGTRDLDDGAIAIVPAGAPFSVSPGPTVTVPAAGTTPVTVTCAPTTAGEFMASLRLSAPDVTATPSDIALRCTGDPNQVLAAAPRAVMLGQVRIPDKVTARVMVTGPADLATAELDFPVAGVTVRGAPAPTPAVVELEVTPASQGSIDNHLHLTPSGNGPPLTVAITGTAVIAQYEVPAALSLGTFCVGQPTIPRILALDVPGSATIQLSAPTLQRSDSPFDLTFIAPLAYPATLLTGERATIAVTPRRQRIAGITSDEVLWQTDIDEARTAHTALTATFIGDGGAIAPDAISFGSVAIYTSASNAQQVTLQNCSNSAIQLDAPIVPAPFAIDSPNFPSVLGPSEIAAFSVGFHPTQPIPVTKTLAITSPQLSKPLTVELSGEGTASGSGGGAGSAGSESTTSFYACGGCAARDPSSALAVGLMALGVLVPRRRRPRRRARPRP